MIEFPQEEAGLLDDGRTPGPVPADGRLGGEVVRQRYQPPPDLPPPVILLDDCHGPLLLPPLLELRDVALVFPLLPVGTNHNLRFPKLHPILSGPPTSPNFLN